MHFVTCPKQGFEMEAVILPRVGFLAYFCPKQGQDFKPSAAPLYPKWVKYPPPDKNAASVRRWKSKIGMNLLKDLVAIDGITLLSLSLPLSMA